MNKEKLRGHIGIFISVLFFALNIPAVKVLFSGWFTPGEVLIYRMCFGAIAFWLISLFLKREHLPKKDFMILVAGGVGLFAMQMFYMLGLDYTSPVDTSIILTIPPVLVLLFSAILGRERLTSRKVVGMLVGMSGALLIVLTQVKGGTVSASLKGNLFVVVSAVSWAVYLLITQSVSKRYSPITILKWMFLWAAIPSVLIFGKGAIAGGFYEQVPTWHILSIGIFILIFPTVVSYILIPPAMKKLNASVVSMYGYVTPIIASTVSIIAGQASLRWDQPVAALLIFVGVYLVTSQTLRKARSEKR